MLRRYAFTASCALATVAHAQRSSFVTTLGRDTLSFEQYSRVADTITGDWVTLYGGIMYHHYVIVLRGDGTVARYSLNLHRASGKAEGSVTLQLDPDSITATSDGNAAPRRVGAPRRVDDHHRLREAVCARARCVRAWSSRRHCVARRRKRGDAIHDDR